MRLLDWVLLLTALVNLMTAIINNRTNRKSKEKQKGTNKRRVRRRR